MPPPHPSMAQSWARKLTQAMDYDSFGHVIEASEAYESLAKEMTKFADEAKPAKQDRVRPNTPLGHRFVLEILCLSRRSTFIFAVQR